MLGVFVEANFLELIVSSEKNCSAGSFINAPMLQVNG